MGGKVEVIGLVTTPLLHYIVVCLKGAYGQPTLAGYYDKLSSAFNKFCPWCQTRVSTPPAWCSMELMVWGPCPWLSSIPTPAIQQSGCDYL